jgi:hypothetical protein
MTSPSHPSAVRVTANSFHSEWRGQATSVLGNENIGTEVAVYSPVSLESPTTYPTDVPTEGPPMNGSPRSTITNGDLLAWL